MEDKKYVVYLHQSPSNKVYIGITCRRPTDRWANGKGYRKQEYFNNAILKYGWNNFKHIILFENLKREDAEIKEQEFIKKYKSNNRKFGYNIQNGGFSGNKFDDETKSKIGNANKGEKNGMYGKHSWNYKKHGCFSKETLEKMSKAKKGKKLKKETVEKIEQTKIAKYGKDYQKQAYKKISKENKEKIKRIFIENAEKNRYKKRKKVNQYTLDGKFIKTWESISIAGKQLFNNSKGDTISNCCRGVSKTGSGFLWKYYDGTTKDIEPYHKKLKYKLVNQYDLHGNFIKQWENQKEAEISIYGKYSNKIGKCCRGERKKVGKYIWKYANK